ncbi:drug/metabolite transporter (DMT)-like permease [Bradyrhizobium yuanmingense]
MLDSTTPGVRPRIAPAGLMFLAITSIGWGFNWPVTKFLLAELPPLTLRGVTGVLGALLLALLAVIRRQSLYVEARSGRACSPRPRSTSPAGWC